MSSDPVLTYRAELQRAVVRTIRADQHRRRVMVTVLAALAAALIVSGAIASQSTGWLGAPLVRDRSWRLHMRITRGSVTYAKCQAASPTSPCRLQVDTITVHCPDARRPATRVVSREVIDCVVTAGSRRRR